MVEQLSSCYRWQGVAVYLPHSGGRATTPAALMLVRSLGSGGSNPEISRLAVRFPGANALRPSSSSRASYTRLEAGDADRIFAG